jgi:hypothetical protein
MIQTIIDAQCADSLAQKVTSCLIALINAYIVIGAYIGPASMYVSFVRQLDVIGLQIVQTDALFATLTPTGQTSTNVTFADRLE